MSNTNAAFALGGRFLLAILFILSGLSKLGAAPSANDSLTVTVNSGALFIYGATTDNTTQHPSVQLGRK